MAKPYASGVVPIVHAIPCAGDVIRLRPISDIHVGDAHCDMAAFRRMIAEIAADPDCYTCLVGDLCNTAIAGSKSDSYSEKMKPGEQARVVADMLRPIAGKILSIVPGNHEERVYKTTGVDITELIADMLGIHDRYRGTSATMFLTIGDGKGAPRGRAPIYTIYTNHGHGGGGRRAGSKINSLQDLGYIIDADIIIAGHTHMPATLRQARQRCVNQTKTVELVEQVFVNLASGMTYPGSYGDRGGYQPPSNRYPIVELSARKHDVTVIS